MTLQAINQLTAGELREILFKCCSCTHWVQMMIEIFPVQEEGWLLSEAEKKWYLCSKKDWLEAFTHHPKIGDVETLKKKFPTTGEWAFSEQAGVHRTAAEVLEQLAESNRIYEEKFGYIFIVCATGKAAEEMLDLLDQRILNDPEDEIFIAMGEQNKITLLRLQKLLAS